MAIKKFRPTSPGKRFQTVSTFKEITSFTPERSLLLPLKKTGGRNVYGRITSWHKGGGHKRRYRLIDFKRDKREIPARVASLCRWGETIYPRTFSTTGRETSDRESNGRYQTWQCPSLTQYSYRHTDSQYRVESRKGRSDHPERRSLWSVDGKGGFSSLAHS